jgi:hypothetical protein
MRVQIFARSEATNLNRPHLRFLSEDSSRPSQAMNRTYGLMPGSSPRVRETVFDNTEDVAEPSLYRKTNLTKHKLGKALWAMRHAIEQSTRLFKLVCGDHSNAKKVMQLRQILNYSARSCVSMASHLRGLNTSRLRQI